jgi:hypothetical protein
MRSVIAGVSMIAAFVAAVPVFAGSEVYVNGAELSSRQLRTIAQTYDFAPPPGRYWYDSRSGAWGLEGHETAGFIYPGHNFGPLSEDASRGDTGVFVNGRELNMIEARTLRQTFGVVYRGRWWLDGRTGYWGAEGDPIPRGNILAALRAQQRSNTGGDNFWSSGYARGNSSGGCGYINVDGVTVGTGSCR